MEAFLPWILTFLNPKFEEKISRWSCEQCHPCFCFLVPWPCILALGVIVPRRWLRVYMASYRKALWPRSVVKFHLALELRSSLGHSKILEVHLPLGNGVSDRTNGCNQLQSIGFLLSLQNEFLGLQQCHMGFHDPEVFNESADGAAGRLIAGRESKSKTKINGCSN